MGTLCLRWRWLELALATEGLGGPSGAPPLSPLRREKNYRILRWKA